MVSSAGGTTRERILDAAKRLIERDQKGPVSMGAIAKEAGLSRQALYLTFADRTDLYIALARRVDELRGIPAERSRLAEAPDGVSALTWLIEMQARLNPAHRPVAHAFDVLRHQDPDAERAWQDRVSARLELCEAIVGRLAQEGALRPDLDVTTGADMLSALTSFRTWEDLVFHCGWSAERYRTHLTTMVLDWLLPAGQVRPQG